MYGVKDQGGCGSCWAFASNSALEGTIAAKTKQPPVRLSEQHVVDCSLTNNQHNIDMFGENFSAYGCNGGWMSWAWYFQHKAGVMLDSDYPYTSGSTGRETRCAHDWNKVIGKRPISWGRMASYVPHLKEKVAEAPLAIAIHASSSAFQFYRSGVLTSASSGCGNNRVNHAVVLVGYTDQAETAPVRLPCSPNRWWHTCPEYHDDREKKEDANGYHNYWKIQNSWGTGWGD